jgi:translation initiation factor eIF-2B subunit gamma
MSAEIQAVVLAAGRGNNLYPYTQDTPKALLPVANRPLLYYPLLLLQNEGFAECLVIVASAHCEEIKGKITQTCEESGLQIVVTFVDIPESELDQGSMVAFKHIHSQLSAKTVLLLSCDLVCNVPLNILANIHRINNSSVTVLLGHSGPPNLGGDNAQDEERKKWRTKDEDVFGVDGNRLILLHRSTMGDDQQVSRSLLIRHPRIQLRFGLTDAHMYLIERSVLEFVVEKTQLESLYDEALPELVKRQFRKPKEIDSPLDQSHNTSSMFMSQASTVMSAEMDLETIALETSSHNVTGAGGLLDAKEVFRCFAHIADEKSLCVRVKTPNVYSEINRLIPRSYSSLLMVKSDDVTASVVGRNKPQVSHDSLVGSNVQIAEKSSVKKSVVGNSCVLRDRSKVVSSVVMDHVEIEEKVTVQNCVVGHHVIIEEGATLKDCYIGSHVVIPKAVEYKGETLSSDDFQL